MTELERYCMMDVLLTMQLEEDLRWISVSHWGMFYAPHIYK